MSLSSVSLKSCSTLTNLVLLRQFFGDALCDQVYIIYTDFAKAFDTIDNFILLRKLDNFGLISFLGPICLTASSTFISMEFHCDFWYTTGTILFKIFIND